MKIKNLHAPKCIVKKKDKLQIGRKYLLTVYLIKELDPQQIYKELLKLNDKATCS